MESRGEMEREEKWREIGEMEREEALGTFA